MSTATPLEGALSEAADREAKYEWMAAADAYLHAIERLPQNNDTAESARLTERLAECYLKGAFQSENREEFKKRMMLAKASFNKALSHLGSSRQEQLSVRLKAREHFADFWTRDTAKERSDICEKCVSLAQRAVDDLEREQGQSLLALTRKNLLTYIFELHFFDRDPARLRRLFDVAMEAGQKAISHFEASREDISLVESLHSTIWFLTDLANFVLEPAKFKEAEAHARLLAKKLAGLAERLGTPYELCLSREAAAWVALELDGDVNEALKCFRLAISSAELTKDSYLTGRLYEEIVYATTWAVKSSEEDLQWRRETLEKGLEIAPRATALLEVSLHGGFLSAASAFTAECHSYLASFIETDPEKRKDHLRRAIEKARKGWDFEKQGWSWALSSHALSRALYQLATQEQGRREKAQLLREALPIRESMVLNYELLTPNSWDTGVANEHLALVKAELSKVEEDQQTRTQLLRGAVSAMERCLEQCSKWASTPTLKRDLGLFHERYADILLQSPSEAADNDNARSACNSYKSAITLLTESKNPGSIPALRWKLAKAQDGLGQWQEASESFEKAAEEYRLVGQKTPGLTGPFGELGSYMDAWAAIERARLHHDHEQYSTASQKYSDAANILQATKSWNHLAKHYMACSSLERGESYGQQEELDSAVKTFTVSLELFREAKEDLSKMLKEERAQENALELRDWLQVTEARHSYSLGRMRLEEARVLDKKGEKAASASEYQSTAEAFTGLLAEVENERERGELESLILFCNALAKMKEAETKASAELYQEASELFGKAEKTTRREKFRLLCLAHSSISKALASGTLFRRTRNTQAYAGIKNDLEAAGDYYEEAGFKNAADWTRATQRLFDALAYLATAEAEMDSKKKTELYHLAEKHLEFAGNLYDWAGYPAKREEAMRHLERARQEKRILLTPMEALAEDPTESGASFSPPGLNRDEALGLERFETASIVGHLILPKENLGVGSGLTLELELANMGRTPATLVKLENLFPEGFELDKAHTSHRFGDGFLDMKGKRLEYMKTHEVKVPLRATRKGFYQIRPRVLYADEKGNYRFFEFEPAALTVGELGISGWLRGPSR